MRNNFIYQSVSQLVQQTTSPIQKLIQKPCMTHSFINRQIPKILWNDGYYGYAQVSARFIEFLNKGSNWADNSWKNIHHFYNPLSGKGWLGCRDARNECEFHWKNSLNFWHIGNFQWSFFYLGATLHLVQDMCVPHHAKGTVVDGHQDYESWVHKNRLKYAVYSKGLYNDGHSCSDWITENARFSLQYFGLVKSKTKPLDYHTATEVLLPMAQRSSVGVVTHFFKEVGLIDNLANFNTCLLPIDA